MMNDVGKEYGAALYMLSAEEGQEKEYASALKTVKEAFEETPEFLELINSPALSLEERLSVIDKVFGEKLPENVLSFLKLLCEKGRLPCFSRAEEEFTALFNASQQVFYAKITSAAALTEEEKEMLIRKLEATQHGKIRAEYSVDPALMGGITVEIDGKILDGSLRHRLYEIKEVMNL